MKAVVRKNYGPPGVIIIDERTRPEPKEGEVLIRVYASTANRSDYHVLTGKPFYMRFFTGLFKPKTSTLGSDFAGEVIETGGNVTLYKPGDKVMGFGGVFGCGALAEFISFPEKEGLVPMPAILSYDEAAACLEGPYYAATGLLQMTLQPGQTAMVYGATGAIGSAQVQLLKYFGLRVTAVCAGEHMSLVLSLGADQVIDYQSTDITKMTERFDFIFDAVDKLPFLNCKHLLTNKGVYNSSGGFIKLLWAGITWVMGGKKVLFIPPKDIKGTLTFLKELVEQGKFKPVIDRKYPLDKIADAFDYVATGQKVGTVIVTLDT